MLNVDNFVDKLLIVDISIIGISNLYTKYLLLDRYYKCPDRKKSYLS